jgi:sorbitol/mannitol transport system permease protein
MATETLPTQQTGRFRRRSRSREDAHPLLAVVAWIVAVIVFFPVLHMVLTGFKTETDAVDLPPRLVFQPTLENYAEIFRINFWPFFQNSIVAALTSTALVMVLGVPAAYGIVFHPPKRSRDILFFFISTKFLPPAGVIVPLYIIYRDASLLGTVHGLIILYTAMNLPLAIWMMRSFFEEVPQEIIDAARLDGAGLFREMSQIVLPMVVPGLVATVFLAIIFAWNEFFFAVSLASIGTATVPIFMVRFVTSEGLFWAKLSASCTLAILPIVLLGWGAQRQLVRGLSMGAVK